MDVEILAQSSRSSQFLMTLARGIMATRIASINQHYGGVAEERTYNQVATESLSLTLSSNDCFLVVLYPVSSGLFFVLQRKTRFCFDQREENRLCQSYLSLLCHTALLLHVSALNLSGLFFLCLNRKLDFHSLLKRSSYCLMPRC